MTCDILLRSGTRGWAATAALLSSERNAGGPAAIFRFPPESESSARRQF